MTETYDRPKFVQIPIGVGSGLDGGPFFAASVTSFNDDEVTVVNDEGFEDTVTLSYIQEALTEEMERGEPILVSGPPREVAAGTIRLPLMAHYTIESNGNVRTVHPTAQKEHWDEITRLLRERGGRYAAEG